MERVTILGSGVMGGGIALSLALAGLDVRLWGRRAAGVEERLAAVRADAAFLVDEELATRVQADRALARIAGTVEWEPALAGAELVVEAVKEELSLKQELLRRAELELPADAITASTTSGLSPTRIADGLARPERFLVAHYAQPAHLMMLVEVVPGKRTDPAVVEAVSELLRRTGKLPVPCADVPGFVFNRLQQAVLREFVHLVERGHVSPETCDLVLKYGYAHRLPVMGAFEHADLAGIDLVRDVAREVWPDLAAATTPDDGLLGRLVQEGSLGMKSGRGFYDWRERDPVAFRRERDREIVRRLRILRAEE